jgi:hypothetical protein
MPRYQVPMTPAAKTDDERTESMAVKQREIATGKDAAAPVKGSGSVMNLTA